ncbi:arylamine N-acetyltransferase [Streptomyces sp. JV176]|uniref:arylamine N-acetyltransferase family protein n=1 Tax=Streptomyces sp. JV176 TaxID=858630 RepID=UPI002E765CB9|nr:arylamine N-acetyltransferase [Streptomyces sp. JV176]MEE1797994.1 arylamine N-acetyltransferase [Streptomyces sp. JV176]
MLDHTTVAAYLDRISADPPERLDADALRHLHERHVLSVPFDNLDYHRGADIRMDERAVDKIVHQRRGGLCGEINTAFYLLLESLGFDVTLHQGRVHIPGAGTTAPYHHVVMTVAVDGARWIADIGFGKSSRRPLLLDSGEPQRDPHGEFTTRRPDRRSVEVLRNGTPQYILYEEPVELPDFRQTMWWYRTSPHSPFLQTLVCSMPLENGWVILRDDLLTVVSEDGKRTEKLTDDAAVLAAYERWFGMRLERRPVPTPYTNDAPRFSFDGD